MEKLLKGQTILVAGAGGLLGSCLVSELLRQDANVIVVDICLDAMKNRLAELGVPSNNDKLKFEILDVTDESSVKEFFGELGKVDGAVNCTYPRNQTYGAHFFDVSLDSFNENISLHLGSVFLFTQQCAAYFKSHKRPFSLVNISSIYGVIAPKFEVYEDTPMTMPVEYAAIKAAIQHLTKYTVAYIKDSDFRVNCVSPGGILDSQPEAFLNAYKQQTNGQGMLTVNDVIGPIIYLLSEQSRFVTGQNIIVDDGFTL